MGGLNLLARVYPPFFGDLDVILLFTDSNASDGEPFVWLELALQRITEIYGTNVELKRHVEKCKILMMIISAGYLYVVIGLSVVREISI
jgi:hypothetical protein